MSKSHKAFTMIELVFVIVVIGILASIAVPKFAVTRNDAVITKAKTTVSALRSALSTLRQKNILKGNFDDINGSALEAEMEYGLDKDWSRDGDKFTFTCPSSETCVFEINKTKLEKKDCDSSCGMDDL